MAVQPVSLAGKKILVTGPTSQVAVPLLKQLCPIAEVHALARFSKQKDIDRISALPSAGGVAPATIEVLPPCGTNATPSALAALTTLITSSRVVGAINAGARP